MTRPIPLLLVSASLIACTSTETGNPYSDDPGDMRTTELPLDLKLFFDPAMVGASNTDPKLTKLYLQVSELEFITCDGESFVTSKDDWSADFGSAASLSVGFPRAGACALLIRTEPLSRAKNPTLPVEVDGDGAAIAGLDQNGLPFLLALPPQVFALLVMEAPGLSSDSVSSLRLDIDAYQVLDEVTPYLDGSSDVIRPAASGEATSLADIIEESFALKVEEKDGSLATVGVSRSVEEAPEAYCTAACNQPSVHQCALECSPEGCLTTLTEGTCGPEFSAHLSCMLGLNASQIACDDAGTTTTVPYCDAEQAALSICEGGR